MKKTLVAIGEFSLAAVNCCLCSGNVYLMKILMKICYCSLTIGPYLHLLLLSCFVLVSGYVYE